MSPEFSILFPYIKFKEITTFRFCFLLRFLVTSWPDFCVYTCAIFTSITFHPQLALAPPTHHNPIHQFPLLRRSLPHHLNILLTQLSQNPRIRHSTPRTRHRNLLHKPQRPHRTLPITNVFRLDLNYRHARILRRPIMHAIAQVAEPGRRTFGVKLFDAGIGGGRRRACAGYGDPVLRRGVLESYLCGAVVGEVGEFVGVRVGKEEEVGSFALY